jgi:hypothetical protein
MDPEPTPDLELVPVYATGNPALIAVAKSLLNGEGIQFFVKGEELQNLFGRVAGEPAAFFVRAGDETRARELLQDLRPSPPQEGWSDG